MIAFRLFAFAVIAGVLQPLFVKLTFTIVQMYLFIFVLL